MSKTAMIDVSFEFEVADDMTAQDAMEILQMILDNALDEEDELEYEVCEGGACVKDEDSDILYFVNGTTSKDILVK